MKKHLLLLMASIFCSFLLVAQTNVSGTLTNNVTWTVAGSPYTVTGNITVNAGVTLTIETGTVVQFNSGTYILVYGDLNATSATFTANASTTPGFWQGIYVGYEYGSDPGTVVLSGTTVQYAKSLYIRMGDITLTNNTVLNNFSDSGIDIYTAGHVNIDQTTIQNCSWPVYFRGNGSWSMGAGVDLTGNTNDYVFINFRDINSLFPCPDPGIPYYYDSELRVNQSGTLQISPGVKFLGNTGSFINVYGKLKAQGTAADTITFDKFPTASYWRGINFYDNAVDTACIFEYCKFTGSTYNYFNNAYHTVNIDKSSPLFSNCVFTGNHLNLLVRGRSFPVFTNCTFDESTVATGLIKNINVDANAEPIFTNCNISFNELEGRAIGIIASTVYDDSHLKQISFNDYDNITYVMNGAISILDTASMVVDPGIVIKCTSTGYYIDAKGKLEGIGTPSDSIIFTHINDDNYGNPADTYSNGTTTINHSSTGSIYLNGPGASHLKYWKILYAGRTSATWGYALNVGNNCILENSTVMYSYRGLVFWGNAQVLNNTFEYIDWYPVARSFDEGTPVLLGNTISNVGFNGILVHAFNAGDYTIEGMDFAGNTNVAYIIQDVNMDIPEGANITILPGTILKFNGYYNSRITVRGGLKAIGKANNKIIFTSIYDNSVAGNTNYSSGVDPVSNKFTRLSFASSSNDTFNTLRNVEIRYFKDNIWIDNCNVEIDSTMFNFTDSYGIAILGNAAPVITNSQFNNIKYGPIYMDMFANPVFSGNRMANIGYAAITIRGGTLSGTIPVRDFAGYNNITYILDGNLRVDGELTIPEGVVFKSLTDRYFDVYGKLNVLGTAANPVLFTSIDDDSYGNPVDTRLDGVSATIRNYGSRIIFRETSDDMSIVDNALLRYSVYYGIHINNASPTITNCTFYRNAYNGISVRGTSTPTITNCIFDDVPFSLYIDPTAYPAVTTGNQLTGTTAKAIHIFDNVTLTQDATLSKHNFAGVTNIPYMFYRYTVGTSAVLTIEPGVVCKFKSGGYLNVRKGLIADGGSSVDSTIVFTSDRDDFYGGDTYGDGDANVANIIWWQGIHFASEAIDAECILNNCVIKNATANYSNSVHSYNRGAVTLDNSSPSITNSRFEDDKWGILVRNTSLPYIDNCDFVGMDPTYGYGIWNETGTVTVIAENCWWDHDTGPINTTSNPDGQGVRVSANVDFNPWITQPSQPKMGDVSMNGEVMPYDASLILQSNVGNITLSTKQLEVADVSFNGSITSFDASLILQYSVGLITSFEPTGGIAQLKASGIVPEISVSVPYNSFEADSTTFELPVSFTTGEGVKSMDMEIVTNPAHVRFIELNTQDIPSDVLVVSGYDENSGVIKISVASANDLEFNRNDITLVFEFKPGEQTNSDIELVKLTANETFDDATFIVSVGSNEVVTGIEDGYNISALNIYCTGNKCMADINLTAPQSSLVITVYDISGQLTNQVQLGNVAAGQTLLTFKPEATGAHYPSKIYIVTVRGDDFVVTRKLVVK